MLHIRIGLSLATLGIIIGLAACAQTSPLNDYEAIEPTAALDQPEPRADSGCPPELVSHGKYLVKLMGCGGCHTHGALIGEPDSARLLAGSSIGIAITDPLDNPLPGVVYPPNLTPDPDTGLGGRSEAEVVAMIRTGAGKHGLSTSLTVMPWILYQSINDQDIKAIATYLSSLEPVSHAVPGNVARGQKAPAPYVHFGIYRSKGLMEP